MRVNSTTICPCCKGAPYPLRIEITQAMFEDIGYSNGGYGYYSDGYSQTFYRVVWSDGTHTNYSHNHNPNCGPGGVSAWTSPMTINVGSDVYKTENTTLTGYDGQYTVASAYVTSTPSGHVSHLEIGDGTSPVGTSAAFVKQ